MCGSRCSPAPLTHGPHLQCSGCGRVPGDTRPPPPNLNWDKGRSPSRDRFPPGRKVPEYSGRPNSVAGVHGPLAPNRPTEERAIRPGLRFPAAEEDQTTRIWRLTGAQAQQSTPPTCCRRGCSGEPHPETGICGACTKDMRWLEKWGVTVLPNAGRAQPRVRTGTSSASSSSSDLGAQTVFPKETLAFVAAWGESGRCRSPGQTAEGRAPPAVASAPRPPVPIVFEAPAELPPPPPASPALRATSRVPVTDRGSPLDSRDLPKEPPQTGYDVPTHGKAFFFRNQQNSVSNPFQPPWPNSTGGSGH